MSLNNQSSPFNLLYTNTPTYLGGAEVSILTLMRHLDRSRFTPYLLTTADGDLSRAARESGIGVTLNPLPGLSRKRPLPHLRGIRNLSNLVHQQHIDLIHTNCDSSLLPVRYAAALNRVPFVSHIRDFVRGWFNPVNLRVLQSARAVIANSDAVASACRTAGIPARRVVTIYNPIDVGAFSEVSPDGIDTLRRDIGCPAGVQLIGIVGQVQEIKGLREFIQAALKIAENEPDVHFVIVGDANGDVNRQFMQEMKGVIQHSSYSDRIHFTGFRTDVPAVMKAIDILAVPSWTEAFGRVVVEGMATGRAVVGTRVGGISEIITDGVDGLLVPPHDVGALHVAIQRLLHDAEMRGNLGRRGQQTASRFSISKHVMQVQALYDSILVR